MSDKTDGSQLLVHREYEPSEIPSVSIGMYLVDGKAHSKFDVIYHTKDLRQWKPKLVINEENNENES